MCRIDAKGIVRSVFFPERLFGYILTVQRTRKAYCKEMYSSPPFLHPAFKCPAPAIQGHDVFQRRMAIAPR